MRRQKHTTEGGRDCELEKECCMRPWAKAVRFWRRGRRLWWQWDSLGGGESCLFMWGHAEHVKWFNPTHGHMWVLMSGSFSSEKESRVSIAVKYPFAPHNLRALVFLLSDNSSLGLHLSGLLLQVSYREVNWHQRRFVSAIGAEYWLRSDLYSTVIFDSCKKTTLMV